MKFNCLFILWFTLFVSACGGGSTTATIPPVSDTNNLPIAGADVVASVDADDATINGLLTSSDADDVSTAAFAITGGASAPAGFILNTDGNYSFNPADPAYLSLDIGDSQLVTISITVMDDQGGTDVLEIQITVNGVANTPIAIDDIYNTLGNTLLEVGVTPSGSIAKKVSGSVLENDSDLDVGDELTALLETQPVSGGSVSMNLLGHFSYVPPAGQTTITDSFTYRVSDGAKSSIGTVNINISERIWYVDNRSSSGFGTSDDPFASVAEAEWVVADGDTIYVAYGDGTTLGLDNGLTLSIPNVKLIGEGVALVFDSTTLAIAGSAPSITNATGDGITLNAADNTLIMGINIDGVSGDGIVIDDSTGIVIEATTISNSGESAIQGSGADIELFLTNVIIDTVDVIDPSVSDDAIFMAPTASVSLIMSGGSIDGVPGNLGDGIVFKNTSSANVVSMNLDVTAVRFMNIAQDGIKLDNDNGFINAQIGGPTLVEGNIFDVGFRGIQIQTDADPTLSRTNRIMIQNNTITSVNESIQIRHINDQANLSVLDNVVNRAVPASISDLIDVQSEISASTQARIHRNHIYNLGGSDGIKVRVFDGATLTMEASNNDIDGPAEGFDFDVIETGGPYKAPTILNSTVFFNTLSNISSAAMIAKSASSGTNICMDLKGNSQIFDYYLDAENGYIGVTWNSQGHFKTGNLFYSPISDVCPIPYSF